MERKAQQERQRCGLVCNESRRRDVNGGEKQEAAKKRQGGPKMLIDHYEREDVFAQVPELAQETDPVLRKLDRLLDDDEVYQQVRSDFGKRYRFTLVHGQHSTPVEVLLRMLILKHLYQWSYQETEARVKDSLVLRWFCRVGFHRLPDASTLWRWEQTLRPETVHALQQPAGQVGTKAKGCQGGNARVEPRARQ